MDLFSPAMIQQTLQQYDRVERDMQRTLEKLAASGSESTYNTYARSCARAMQQIAIRRQMFASMLKHV